MVRGVQERDPDVQEDSVGAGRPGDSAVPVGKVEYPTKSKGDFFVLTSGRFARRFQVSSDQCTFLKAASDRQGKTQPLFLLYRNGALKQQIEGANTPALRNSILELTPLSADTDDLEVGALHIRWDRSDCEHLLMAKWVFVFSPTGWKM